MMAMLEKPSPADELLERVACPTCGAEQVLADSCRRCESDLRLLGDFHRQRRQLRQRCLAMLHKRRLRRASDLARRACEFSPDEANVRLLAVCYLLEGKFAAASKLCKSFGEKSRR